MKKPKSIAAQVNASAKQLRKLSKRMTRAMKPPTKPVFYVSSHMHWFLVHANNEKQARREGRKEYGGHLSGVRLATASEIAYYKSVKSSINECD